MSSKKNSSRLSVLNQHKNPFSDKELIIIRDELADSGGASRNMPIFQDCIDKYTHLRELRIDPYQMMSILESTHRAAAARASMSGQTIPENKILDSLIDDLSERVDFRRILDILIPVAKAAKIKREKRALLWAAGEILTTISEQHTPKKSLGIRSLILASINYSIRVNREIGLFLAGNEPYSFSYKYIINNAWTEKEWRDLLEKTHALEQDFTYNVSHTAMSLFKKISRPFGLRFHRIVRYAQAMKDKQKRNILLPGETQPQASDSESGNSLDHETIERLSYSIMADYSPGRRLEYAKDALNSIQSAAAGEIDEPELNLYLNAAAYTFLSFMQVSPFLVYLYKASGDNAEQINPADEKELIVDIKGSPDNPSPYRRYGELLEQKGELLPALQVYSCVSDLTSDDGEKTEIKAKMDALIHKITEEREKSKQTESNILVEQQEAPASSVIATP